MPSQFRPGTPDRPAYEEGRRDRTSRSFYCADCDVYFKSGRDLIAHAYVQHDDRTYYSMRPALQRGIRRLAQAGGAPGSLVVPAGGAADSKNATRGESHTIGAALPDPDHKRE
jgi:hypothetical protein